MKPRPENGTAVAAHAARSASVRAGVVTTLAICGGLAAYVGESWERPNRSAMAFVVLGGCLLALAVGRMPTRRLRRRATADRSLVLWNVLSIALLTALVALDGDPRSPVGFAFAVPLVLAALSFPARTVACLAAADLAACVVALAAVGSFDVPYATMLAATLVCVGMGCAWQARIQQRTLSHVSRLSRTDELTGCLNRRGFVDDLHVRLQRQARYGAGFGLVLIDLDGFKAINDEHGHAAGDEMLRRTAAALAGTIRGGDVVARLGGDEFAVLLDECDALTAELVAERLRTAIAPHAAASAGYAACPDDANDADALYRRADARLYETKRFVALERAAVLVPA
ncbi:MAG TPA: GGDEF domain-containing protein [Solirubrobacteraceae bacterium]|jgi:diguanylate cyclase (GGDEF)-like protein